MKRSDTRLVTPLHRPHEHEDEDSCPVCRNQSDVVRTMALAFGHWDIESAKRMFWELRRLHANLPEGFDLKPMKDLDLSLWLGKIPGTFEDARSIK